MIDYVGSYHITITLPHTKDILTSDFKNNKSDLTILEYAMSIDQLEKMLDRDLFHALPDPLEQQLEAVQHSMPSIN
jgi:hypothetical protein